MTKYDNILSWTRESYRTHILEGLKTFQRFFAGKNKPLALRLSTSEEFVNGMCLIIIAFHDVAKTYEPYQFRIRAGKGARFHEYYSAYLVMQALRDRKDFDKDAILLVCSTIASHHIPLRRGYNFSQTFRECVTLEISMNEDRRRSLLNIYEEISLYVKRFNKYAGTLIKEVAIELHPRVRKSEVLSYLKEVEEELKSMDSDLYFQMLPFLRILMVCDNYAAALNREDRKHRVAEDLISIDRLNEIRSILRGRV